MHQHHGDREAQAQAGDGANQRPRRAFTGHHCQDLPARQPEVSEQAELLAPRQHLGAETCRHAKQANGDCHALQPVSNGKAAVENFE